MPPATPKTRGLRTCFTALACATATAGWPSNALAAGADANVTKLDAEALGAYVANQHAKAEKKLKDALQACAKSTCSPSVRAQLHRDLGVVYAGGLAKPDLAKAEFVAALEADPSVALPPTLGTPAVQQVFDEVKAPPPPPEPKAAPPPPPPPVPEAVALRNLSDARWTSGLGFVRDGDAASSAEAAQADTPSAVKVPPLKSTGRNRGGMTVGLSFANWSPQSRTGRRLFSATSFKGFLVDVSGGHEWRDLTRWVAPRFDIGVGLGFGFGNDAGDTQSNLTTIPASGHFGIDATPLAFLGIGPFVGYRFQWFSYGAGAKDATVLPHSSAFDHGLEVGGHIRLRTLEHAGGNQPTAFLDGTVTQRYGQSMSAQYVGAMSGISIGPSSYFFGRVESRLASQGSVAAADLGTPTSSDDINAAPADALARGMANDLTAGIGIAGGF